MARRIVAVLAVAAVISACGAKGNAAEEPEEGPATTAASAGPDATEFGTLESPCGPAPSGKTVTIDPAEAGTGTDKLYVGVATDRTSEAQPGLNKEMWDASVAFAGWCNAQGGVAGIPIEPVDADGQLIHVEAAMTTACTKTFALVGGGWALDNQVFNGKDISDFGKCGLIAFPGFSVTTEFSEAPGVVQPLPNPPDRRSTVFYHELAELRPDEIGKIVAVYPEGLPALVDIKDQIKAAASTVPGIEFLTDIATAVLGQDFSITAQKVLDSGATGIMWVGEPVNFSSLLFELKAKGWKGFAFATVNTYDQKIFVKGDDVANDVFIDSAFHMFEEIDDFPIVQQLIDIIESNGPADPTIASLSMQTFSANLLFAQAVKECVTGGDGMITRSCVLDAAEQVHDWTAGGLHAPTDPGANEPTGCTVVVGPRDGAFTRVEPKDKEQDDGFRCDTSLIVDIET